MTDITEELLERHIERYRCPTCGHLVESIFDHIAIDCEKGMSEDTVRAMLMRTEKQGHITVIRVRKDKGK